MSRSFILSPFLPQYPFARSATVALQHRRAKCLPKGIGPYELPFEGTSNGGAEKAPILA